MAEIPTRDEETAMDTSIDTLPARVNRHNLRLPAREESLNSAPETDSSRANMKSFIFPPRAEEDTTALPSTSLPPPNPTPPQRSPSILETAATLPLIPRFRYLLTHTKILIQSHGPYSINHAGHLVCDSTYRSALTSERIAGNLAAAQDSLATRQPNGPVFEDLKIFHMLWETSVLLIETILDSNELELESFGWGMYALSSGYSPPTPDPLFETNRARLKVSLDHLPGLNRKREMGMEAAVKMKTPGAEKIFTLANANRSVHICATMMAQSIREDWKRVRWWHVISVVERWVGNLGWSQDNWMNNDVEDEKKSKQRGNGKVKGKEKKKEEEKEEGGRSMPNIK